MLMPRPLLHQVFTAIVGFVVFILAYFVGDIGIMSCPLQFIELPPSCEHHGAHSVNDVVALKQGSAAMHVHFLFLYTDTLFALVSCMPLLF